MKSKQTQKAGDNAQQLQANNMIINLGIDERRAREIYQEMNLQSKQEFTKEALEIASKRVTEFENILLPKMETIEGAFDFFADPGFQLLLAEAQKAAASTEKEMDYEMLTELLINRTKIGDERYDKAAINRAVKIIDEVSDEALLGLTLVNLMDYIMTDANTAELQLDTLDSLCKNIIGNNKLPEGMEWIDHLEMLYAIRVNRMMLSNWNKNSLIDKFNYFIEVGINKSSDEYSEALEMLENADIPSTLLTDSEFSDEYVIMNPYSINMILADTNKEDVIKSVYQLYDKNESSKKKNANKFLELFQNYSTLNKLIEWRKQITYSFGLTRVGFVITNANLRRIIPDLYVY